MNLAIISFTNHGTKLNKEIGTYFENKGIICECYGIEKYATIYGIHATKESISEWTGRMFQKVDGLIFVGATGIAVRAIAPYVLDKAQDPAVVVIDEQGNYAISLLSGHLGGANELAIEVANAVQAVPVITTATDINKKFAVDVFARKNNMIIKDMKIAKMIAAEILDKESIGIYSDFNIKGQLHSNLYRVYESQLKEKIGIYIGIYDKEPFEVTLKLIPKVITIGIGCKKDTSYETIKKRVEDVLYHNGILLDSIDQVASIDLKKKEAGLLMFCKEYHLPITFYSQEELKTAKGDFKDSPFVESITGVGNVCERAAVITSNGILIQEKSSGDGVTIALAMKEWSVEFE